MTSVDASQRRTRAVSIGLFVLVLVASCAGFVERDDARSRARDTQQRAGASAALTTYLQRVRVGNVPAAYAQLCSDVLDGYSEADHAAFLRSQPAFTAFELGDPVEHSGMDGTYIDIPVRFRDEPGTVVISVGMQTNGPRICDGPGWRR